MAPRTLRHYGILDIVFACVYVVMFFHMIPPYSAFLRWFFGLLAALMLVSGFGLILAKRWGHRLGVAVGLLLLGFTLTVVTMLVAAAAYLRGVYGAFGQGASYVTLVAIAIVVEAFGLLGAFQTHRLLRREVREYFAP